MNVLILVISMATFGWTECPPTRVEKLFNDNQIVPDTVAVAPKKIVKVRFLKHFALKFKYENKSVILMLDIISKWCEC